MEMGKKKTSIYVNEDLWLEWSIFVIKQYGSSRKMSEALEDAMKEYMDKKK